MVYRLHLPSFTENQIEVNDANNAQKYTFFLKLHPKNSLFLQKFFNNAKADNA